MNETTSLEIPATQIEKLDLSSLESIWNLPVADLLKLEAKLCLNLKWPTREDDPRELSEIPECRLWSLRADALCPWLPLLLERSSGQLSRHIAMLIPHSFSKTEGIKFNDDALS
ncbi:CRR6 family NdhI maturation factor, partial [Synechococcus sp.]